MERTWHELGIGVRGQSLQSCEIGEPIWARTDKMRKISEEKARAGIWEEKLRAAAAALRVSLESLPTKKSAAEKVQLAALMKTTTSVSNGWLAKRLEMGKPGSVTQYVRRFRQRGGAMNRAFKSALSKVHT